MKEFVVLDVSKYESIVNKEAWTLSSIVYPESKPFYYLFMEKPLNDIGIKHFIKPFDDIDKSKTWFISFNVNHGLWDHIEIDLWSTIPDELLNELIHGNAYLIMNNENEYDTTAAFRSFYKMYYKNKLVPANKLILLTPAIKGKELYKEYVIHNGIPKEDVINVEYSCHIDFTFDDSIISKTNNIIDTTNKSKKYICLNRAFRLHRPALIGLLSENNSLDLGYVSLGYDKRVKNLVTEHHGWIPYLNDTMLGLHWDNNVPMHFLIKSKLIKGIKKLETKLPLTVDKDEFETNYAQWDTIPIDHIKDSYFSVVTSTHFFEWQEKSGGWNEKEWKPVLMKHPFIIVNRPHILKQMRKLGFLTFSRWFDESYDDIEDDWTRLHAVACEINRLSNIPSDEWDKMKLEMTDILEYNRHILINKRWENVFYMSDLKNLLTYIK